MAWTNYQLFLAFLMLVTGSINTLSTKWADDTKSLSRDGVVREFDHPFFQASCMFFGELLCLLMFKIMYNIYSRRGDGSEDVQVITKGSRNFNQFVLFLPAMCDMLSTSIMYIGLNLTYASSFQMLRGSVIIFVGMLSVGFLDRVLNRRQWVGMVAVIIGLAIVGTADFISSDHPADHGRNDIITGDLLILVAQIITSVQMVVEEKFVSGSDIPPLQLVGWEGTFGLIVLSLLQIPFYFIYVGYPFSNNARGSLEDTVDAFVQLFNNWKIMIAMLGNIVSIAFFNFAGVSVTKEMSATTRMVLDSARTLVIWSFSLLFLNEKFHWLQLLGFGALLLGMAIYNNITCSGCMPLIRSVRSRYNPMVDEDVIENHTADIAEIS